MVDSKFSISYSRNKKPLRQLADSGLFFKKVKNKILGQRYDLSLVFISPSKSKMLNAKYRKVSKSTDILSFPLDKKSGEIYICLKEATKKAKLHKRSRANYLAFLFIHGLVHLKGFSHGSRMESIERKYRSFFNI